MKNLQKIPKKTYLCRRKCYKFFNLFPMKRNNNIFSFSTLIMASPWIMLIVGVALYAIVYFGVFEANSVWREIFIKVADILVIGVILGYFTNIAKMFGIFKQDLREIVYMEEHLQKRNDLEKLWDTVSKQMFKNKFPAIHTDFLQALKKYFPDDVVSFYNNYNVYTKVEWHDKENHLIKVTDTTSFELVAESKSKKIEYPLRTWTRVKDGDLYEEKMLKFSVNGKELEIQESAQSKDHGDTCEERIFPLSDSEKYEIKYVREKIYSIDTDYYIGFRAKYIVNNLSVALYLPEDIEALFTARGTQGDFEEGIVPDSISKQYKGIVLPRQGYTFVLRTL